MFVWNTAHTLRHYQRISPRVASNVLTSCLSTKAGSQQRSLYDVLGVNSSANKDEIKEAFFKLSKELHPDVNPKDPKTATEEFRELASAYEVLGNEQSRKEYDREREVADRRRPKSGDFASFRHRTRPRSSPIHQKDIDLSEERMKKAWEAYKQRWALEEERLEALRQAKIKLRKEIDQARQVHYANMSAEEKERLRDNMRLMRTPGTRSGDDRSQSSDPNARPQTDQEDDDFHPLKGNFRKSTKEEPEDLKLWGSARSSTNLKDMFDELRETSTHTAKNLKQNWNEARFFEADTPNYHGRFNPNSNTVNAKPQAIAGSGIVTILIFCIYFCFFHKTEYSDSNPYLKQLLEERERQNLPKLPKD